MNLKIKEYKNNIDEETKSKIMDFIKSENPDSILAKLSLSNINAYIDILIKSNKLYLFTCELNNDTIGYAVLADKPKYLMSEFKNMKFKIFLNLIFNLNILTIIDILISLLKIDLFKINKNNKEILNKNLNLNLIAIKNSFRSRGYGSFFLNELIKKFSDKDLFETICCETYSDQAESFYIKKLNFYKIGKKIRTKGLLTVLAKKLKY
ncbi:GNAT family N-acetyltransferase [Candidatus Pelagibacter bacterium]|jgi:hypothetical protein|nr:GNAT family N-acetyltransferase [Candidatus Pelagibacter bacterium]